MAQTKSQFMVSVDSSLLAEFRDKNVNMSQFVFEAMTKYKDEIDEKNPEIKEKRLLEQLENEQKMIENSQKNIEIAKKTLENIENEKILYSERQKNEAAKRAEAYKTKISREIGYWPIVIKNRFLSTPMKREEYFRKRAKLLEISLEDYMTEVVANCEKTSVM